MFLVGTQALIQYGDKDGDHSGTGSLAQTTVPIGARFGVKRYRTCIGIDYWRTWRGDTTYSVRQLDH